MKDNINNGEFPKLLFDIPFNELAAYEAWAGGYLGYAKVEQSDGSCYPVIFYDHSRLAQDLNYEVSVGRMCVADVGMIVLSEVTFDNMNLAVRRLAEEGFFDKFKPMKPT